MRLPCPYVGKLADVMNFHYICQKFEKYGQSEISYRNADIL